MGKPRWDTYEIDRPDSEPHRTFFDAMERKQELIKQGYRVKIRKNVDGIYVVFKKHDALFHDHSWRDKNG
jgi:hypothetical protein